MCGRFYLLTDLNVITESFQIQEVTCGYMQGNNISLAQQVSVVVCGDGKNQLNCFRWGLIPYWAKDPSMGNKLINAQAESVAAKPSFKNAFRKRRCLIVADGFYEWKKLGKKSVPCHFSLKSGQPFGFAGLYEIWKSPERELVKTCAIITTDSNDLVMPIHDRMPVIVPKDKEKIWINMEIQDRRELESLLNPYPTEEMEMAEGFAEMP